MCIAILKTKKGKISDEALRNSFNRNSDGAGIAYTVNNKLIIEKGIFTPDALINAVREAEKRCDNNMLIHCRIGTSGIKTAYNTHPFEVNKNVCLIHNGILDINVPAGSKENDTQLFIKKYLNKIDTKTLMHNEQVHKLIEEAIGKGNKFVLLDNKGYYKILNEKAGHWKDNVWYSNESYKEIKTSYAKPYNYFWDDDYEYDYNSNWYNEKKLEDGIDQGTYYKVMDAIYNLKPEYFLHIGETPIYCFDTEEIISLDAYGEDSNGYCYLNCEYLANISEDLYGEYIELYDEELTLSEYMKGEANGNNDNNVNIKPIQNSVVPDRV